MKNYSRNKFIRPKLKFQVQWWLSSTSILTIIILDRFLIEHNQIDSSKSKFSLNERDGAIRETKHAVFITFSACFSGVFSLIRFMLRINKE